MASIEEAEKASVEFIVMRVERNSPFESCLINEVPGISTTRQ